jgi:thiol-disulfide isomerase/thioredoxin
VYSIGKDERSLTSAPRHPALRSRLVIAAAAAFAALALGACGSSGDSGNPDSKLSAEQASEPLEGASPQLTAIRQQASELLDGGTEAFEARLAELRGTPVVVNKWASWCGPCRLEFPFFQSLAQARGAEIAFLGVDANDSEDAAETFLGELPLPYPSYLDPDQDIAAEIGAPANFPATAFYDASGELVHTRQGGYQSEDDLAADINTYLR